MKIALCIPHAAHIPERVDALKRLRDRLWASDPYYIPGPSDAVEIIERDGPCRQDVWSERMWSKALATDATHIVGLADDTIVAPFFWSALRLLLTLRPDHIISLASEHPRGPQTIRDGFAWYRCKTWVAGWGYVLPRRVLEGLMVWRKEQSPDMLATWGEDMLINEYACRVLDEESWHPCPTIVKHDHSLARTTAKEPLPDAAQTTVPWDDWPVHMKTDNAWYREGIRGWDKVPLL
jgi:hypothetical protein